MNTFFKRTFSTVLLLSIFAVIVFADKQIANPVFCVVAMFLAYVGALEFANIIRKAGYDANGHLAAVITSLSVLLAYLFGELSPSFWRYSPAFGYSSRALFFFLLPIALLCLYAWSGILFAKDKRTHLLRMMGTFMIYVILAVPFLILLQIYYRQGGQMILLYIVLVTKMGDTGAYVIGTLSNKLTSGGNHKMCPNISPGKSYEGMAGGLLTSIGFSIAILGYSGGSSSPSFDGSVLLFGTLFGAVLFFGGMAGDLAESVLKRTANIKDSGRIFPGIGGVLDLVDSLLINAVIAYIVIITIVIFTNPIFR